MAASTNVHERAARAEKVTTIVAWCARHGVTAEHLEVAGDQQWVDIAHLAKINPPSAETRQQVIAAMRPATDNDPFADLYRGETW